MQSVRSGTGCVGPVHGCLKGIARRGTGQFVAGPSCVQVPPELIDDAERLEELVKVNGTVVVDVDAASHGEHVLARDDCSRVLAEDRARLLELIHRDLTYLGSDRTKY